MCTTCAVQFDQTTSDAFAAKMLGHLNGAAVMMMTSIGHRTGLLDAMSDGHGRTTEALANKCKLSERYVREWINAMTTGGVVRYDPATRQYHLPPEHASLLTRAAPNNFAATAQWVSVLGSVEDRVVEAFADGRGVPYSAYARFHETMAEESGKTTIGGLDQHIIPMVEGLEARLSAGIDVVDVGCGRGNAMIHLAKRFPRSRFTGLDLSVEATDFASKQAHAARLLNVRFEQRDLTTWDARERFDLITAFDAIHDQARPDLVLQNISRALKPGGIFLMQDIKASSHVENNTEHPLGPFIYTISCMHCMSVSLAQGGVGLGAAWGQELALTMLKDAGLSNVTTHELPHDILNVYYICKH